MQNFLKENGYIWESGISGHFTYGPMGKSLKTSIENFIKNEFDQLGFLEIDTPLILHKDVLIKSGHWDKFKDPMIYLADGKLMRLDHLIEKNFNISYNNLSKNEIYHYLVKYNNMICKTKDDHVLIPNNEKDFEINYRDLMIKSHSGNHEVGLRPETATATYNNFMDLFIYCHKQLPILVYQIGKSFRNEVAPKHGIIRGREFTQAEFQIILKPNQKQMNTMVLSKLDKINIFYSDIHQAGILSLEEWFEKYKFHHSLYAQYILLTYEIFIQLGIPENKIRLRQHLDNEKAFYALDAWDIEVNLHNLGWTEIAGIHDRGSHDLNGMKGIKGETPHILEIAIGVDRIFYSLIDSLWENKSVKEGKSILNIPYHLSSIQVSILPLLKNKPDLVKKSEEIYHNLKYKLKTELNIKGSIGQRYLKNAIKGIPYSVTIDFKTLEDNTVTIRDRDTEVQERVSVVGIDEYLMKKLKKY